MARGDGGTAADGKINDQKINDGKDNDVRAARDALALLYRFAGGAR